MQSKPIPDGSYIIGGVIEPVPLPWKCRSDATNINVRATPSTKSAVVKVIPRGESFVVVSTLVGTSVEGSTSWLELASGGYVSGAIDGLVTERWSVGEDGA